MTASYNIGDKRTFTASFTDESETPIDPTTVVGTVREPDGTLTTPTINNTAVGVYTMVFEFTQPGRHIAYFIGDGAVNAATESEVWARHKGAQ